jgi:DNA-binding SARP family transcriptional activator/WD40 repeat protein
MEIRVLGPVEVVVDGAAVPMGGQKQRTVLAVLVAAGRRRSSADELIAQAYGDQAPDRARRSIHTFISTLRRTFEDHLHSDRRGYVLDVPDEWVDARRFEADLRAGRELIGSDPDAASEALRRALGQWRGHAYSDVEVRDVLGLEIARLDELRAAAVEARIEADLARGLHLELVGELGALVTEYPLRERLRAHHMLALYRAGRQAEALRSYASARTILIEELGVEPSPELQQLELRILDQDPDLTVDLRPSIEAIAVVACDASASAPAMPERERQLASLHESFDAAAADAGARFTDVRGTTIYGVFPSIDRAADAAQQVAKAGGRVALDHGEVDVTDDDVTGPPVTRAARLAAVANRHQVLLSAEAHRALSAGPGEGWTVRSLGHHRLAGTPEPAPIFQLMAPGEETDFGPLLLDRRPAAAPSPGRVPLSGYELRHLRTTDDLGAVYEAYQPSLGRSVHLRVLPPGLIDEPQFIRRFEAEMHRVASVHHPAIVSMLDFWRDPDSAVVVYEPIEPSGGFDPGRPDALDMVMTVAEAVARAHDQGVVHGALHPGTITVDDRGNPYVHNLGLAPIVSAAAQLEATATTAPEAIGEAPTRAADVYALGVLAAEALCGERWQPDQGPPAIDGAVGDIVRACLHPDPAARPATAGDFIAAFTDGLARPMVLKREVRNPYKGLTAFAEVDAADFFGRTRLIDRLENEVTTHSVTAVVGPSGIGKSSAVKAGLVPRLRDDGPSVMVTDMTPGSDPFESLADALARVAVTVPGPLVRSLADETVHLSEVVGSVLPAGAELLLLIDQFEELFTLATGPDAHAFLAMLERELHSDKGAVRIVITLRADFMDRPLAHPRFGALIADRTVMVHGPSREELTDIITLPAAAVGVQLEPALVESVCDDAAAQPGALPLVEHVLTELFDARTSDSLTAVAYHETGGLAAAVGRSAEAAFLGLDPEDQETARIVMMGLVAVGDDAADTRRRARLPQLVRSGLDQSSLERVLDAFVRRRLVVLDHDPRTHQPTAEVAHESLISEWDRLRGWLDDAREDLLMARRIETATRDWTASGRDPSFLLRGGRLEQAEAWHARAGETMTDQETGFLAESRRSADADAKRVRRTRRRLTTVLAAALTITVVLAAVANNARTAADRRATENRVAELTAEAQLMVGQDHDLAIMLALEAYEEEEKLGSDVSGDVMLALHQGTQGSRVVTRIPHGVDVAVYHPTHDELYVDAAGSSELVVYDTNTYAEIRRVDVVHPPSDVAFDGDGSMLAVSAEGARLRLFDPATGALLDELSGPSDVRFPQFSPDDRYLAGVTFEQAFVWDLSQEDPQPIVLEDAAGLPASLGAFSDDSTTFTRGSGHPEEPVEITTYSLPSAAPLDTYRLPVESIRGVTAVPGSDRVIVATATTAEVWELGGATAEREVRSTGINYATMSASGDRFAAHGNETVLVESLDGSTSITLDGNLGDVPEASFSRDSSHLAALVNSGQVTIWDLTPDGPDALANIATAGVDRLIPWMSADGSTVVAFEAHAGVSFARTYAADTGRLIAQSSPSDGQTAVSRSGEFAGVVDRTGTGRIERLDTGEILFEAECMAPNAINDEGTHVVLNETCSGNDAYLVELATGDVLKVWDQAERAEFGPVESAAEGLVIMGQGEGPVVTDVATGATVAMVDLGKFKFGPRLSPDGALMSLGSVREGGFALDVQAILDGSPLEESTIFNPLIDGGPTRDAMAAGIHMATTHNEDTVRVWRLDTGEEWITIPTQASSFAFVTMSPDGTVLYYPDRGAVLRRALLDPGELVAFARSRVTRDFTEQECERYAIAENCSIYTADGGTATGE